MSKEVLYLGLDVHAENIAVVIAEAGRDGELRSYGEIPNTPRAVVMRKDPLRSRNYFSQSHPAKPKPPTNPSPSAPRPQSKNQGAPTPPPPKRPQHPLRLR